MRFIASTRWCYVLNLDVFDVGSVLQQIMTSHCLPPSYS